MYLTISGEEGGHQQNPEASRGAHRQRHGAGDQIGGHQQDVGDLMTPRGLLASFTSMVLAPMWLMRSQQSRTAP